MTLADQLSDEARSVLLAAQDAARSLGHGYIGTEHLLLAVLASGDGPGVVEARRQGARVEAARAMAIEVFDSTENRNRYVSSEEALKAVGVDVESVRRIAEAQFGPGAVPMRVGNPPLTPRARDALERAADRAGGGAGTGLDHLLMGILDDPTSVASQFLQRTCSDPDAVKLAAAKRERG